MLLSGDSITGLWLGGLLGLQHALDPDHLAALSSLLARGSSDDASGVGRRGLLLGAAWGLGHAAVLFLLGLLLLITRRSLPTWVDQVAGLLVSALLLFFGALALHHALVPPAQPRAPKAQPRRLRRSFLVGMAHGLAGSGALATLVLTRLPTLAAQLTYISLFGLGSLLGMAILAGLAGEALSRLGRGPYVARAFAALTGAASAGLGAAWLLAQWRAR